MRRRADAFCERRLAGAGATEPAARAGRELHGLLVGAARRGRRAPSLTPDGAPLAWSLKLGRQAGASPLRVIVEPGIDADSTAAQIAVARALCASALRRLEWDGALPALDSALASVIPEDPAATADWWGTLWVGMALGARGIDLRLYVNVREGSVRARWDRVLALAQVVGAGGLREAMAHAAPVGAPTGACIAIAGGAIAGIRVYVTLANPTAEGVVSAVPARLSCAQLRSFYDGFARALGPPRREGVSIAYDFAAGGDRRADGRGLARVKLELCCELLDRRESERCLSWLAGWSAAHGLAADELTRFREDLVACFGAIAVQYVTLGTRGALDHVSAYCRALGEAA